MLLIVTTKTKSFIRNQGLPEGPDEVNKNLVTVGPGVPTQVPDWVQLDPTFRQGIENRTIQVID